MIIAKEDLENRLADLEDKIIELEADNKSLKDTLDDQNDKIERLEEDLDDAQAALPVMGTAAAMVGRFCLYNYIILHDSVGLTFVILKMLT